MLYAILFRINKHLQTYFEQVLNKKFSAGFVVENVKYDTQILERLVIKLSVNTGRTDLILDLSQKSGKKENVIFDGINLNRAAHLYY